MTKTRRWRIKFSLRAFLVTFILLAVSFSVWSVRAQRQRLAVEWVASNGGQVLYKCDRETAGVGNDGYVSNAPPPVPKFILNILDIHYFTTATLVSLDNSNSQDLTPLQALGGMDTLILRDTKFSDFAPLVKHSGLTNLVIKNSPVRDLGPLSEIPNLDSLTLNQVPASKLNPLRNAKKLNYLYITGCDFADYSNLSTLTKLKYLWLENTSIDSLEPLEKLRLNFIGLHNIGTPDLSPLSSLQQLEAIQLTLLSTDDVSPLSKLPSVNNILIARMPVTQSQIDALQRSHPRCKIDFFPMPIGAR